MLIWVARDAHLFALFAPLFERILAGRDTRFELCLFNTCKSVRGDVPPPHIDRQDAQCQVRYHAFGLVSLSVK